MLVKIWRIRQKTSNWPSNAASVHRNWSKTLSEFNDVLAFGVWPSLWPQTTHNLDIRESAIWNHILMIFSLQPQIVFELSRLLSIKRQHFWDQNESVLFHRRQEKWWSEMLLMCWFRHNRKYFFLDFAIFFWHFWKKHFEAFKIVPEKHFAVRNFVPPTLQTALRQKKTLWLKTGLKH